MPGQNLAQRRRRGGAKPQRREPRPPQGNKRDKRRRKPIPTVDLHVRVALEDVLVRISQADFQKLVMFWMLGAEDVILRGPYRGMETDIILRGHASGMVSVRPRSNTELPKFKLVRASDARKEILEQSGL